MTLSQLFELIEEEGRAQARARDGAPAQAGRKAASLDDLKSWLGAGHRLVEE